MNNKHWTESTDDFCFAIAFDFIAEIFAIMKKQDVSQKELASRMNVSKSRISQIFRNPATCPLVTLVAMARALDHKISIVTYDDGDAQNVRGPVIADIIRACWDAMGQPNDRWQLEEALLRVSPNVAKKSPAIKALP